MPSRRHPKGQATHRPAPTDALAGLSAHRKHIRDTPATPPEWLSPDDPARAARLIRRSAADATLLLDILGIGND